MDVEENTPRESPTPRDERSDGPHDRSDPLARHGRPGPPNAGDLDEGEESPDGDPGMAADEPEPGERQAPLNPQLATHLIRDARARYGDRFRPAGALLRALEASDDPEIQELARASKAPAVQGMIMGKLRVHFPDVEHWAISLVSHVATCKLMEWAITFRGLAHASDLKEWELADRLNHASVHSAGFILAYVPPEVVKDVLQLPVTPLVRKSAIAILRAMREIPLRGRGPWFSGQVPRSIKGQGRHKTVIELSSNNN